MTKEFDLSGYTSSETKLSFDGQSGNQSSNTKSEKADKGRKYQKPKTKRSQKIGGKTSKRPR